MSRASRVMQASGDQWVDAWLSADRLTPAPMKFQMMRAWRTLSRSVAVATTARSAAVSRHSQGVEVVLQAASKGRLEWPTVRGNVAAGDTSDLHLLTPHHVLWLAWLLFIQHRSGDDYRLACILFDHVAAHASASQWPVRMRRTYAEALLWCDEPERAAAVAALLPEGMERAMIELDAVASDPEAHATRLAQLWTSRGLAPVTLISGTAAPYDRLTSQASPVEGGGLVTVVISAFRPEDRLVQAVRSAGAQTWPDLEILVVDDASGSGYSAVLDQVAAIDDRVRIHRMDTNGGTYAIRNWALDHARGDLVTFHDSDDWMHPERIAVQAQWLASHPDATHCASRSARVTESLRFSHVRNLGAQICEPSLMIRREQALATVGYFDNVRKGADAEYRLRLETVTGRPTTVLGSAPLTLQLVDEDSLSGSDIVRHWFAAPRRVYRSCFEQWHASGGDLRLDPAAPRLFYAPQSILGTASNPRPDVVVVSNWLEHGTWNRDCPSARRIVDALVAAGLRVGIADAPQLAPLARMRGALSRRTARLLNAGAIEFADEHALAGATVVVVPEGTDPMTSGDTRVLRYRSGQSRRATRALIKEALTHV